MSKNILILSSSPRKGGNSDQKRFPTRTIKQIDLITTSEAQHRASQSPVVSQENHSYQLLLPYPDLFEKSWQLGRQWEFSLRLSGWKPVWPLLLPDLPGWASSYPLK